MTLKVPRTILSLEVEEEQPILPQQGERGLPPPQQSPDDIAIDVLDVPPAGPLEISSSTTTLTFTAATTCLTRALGHASTNDFGDPDLVAPDGAPSGRKCTNPFDRIPSDLGGSTLGSHRGNKHPPPYGILDPKRLGDQSPPPLSRALDASSPLSFYLRGQPIPDKFEILGMPVFDPASDLTGHVVNYNIHMDLCTTSEGLKCRAFPATLDEQGKMWFASLAPGSIVSFKQLTYLFKARFSNRWKATHYRHSTYGIRNYELTRELGLRPPRSICELNEVISRHISTEETEKWQVEQD
ncbi:hypothetical protein ACLOJK_041061 [Asimina triloba]